MSQGKKKRVQQQYEWEHRIKEGDCIQKMLMEFQPPWCYCDQFHVTSWDKGENGRQCHSWWLFPWVWDNKKQWWTNPPSWTIFILSPCTHCSPLHSPGKRKGTKMVEVPFYFHLKPRPPPQWGCKWYRKTAQTYPHISRLSPPPTATARKITLVLDKSSTEIQSRHQSHLFW